MQHRHRILDLVQRHGWNATSFQTLESGYSYFHYDDDACVAYVDTGAAWIAAGAPLAAPDRLREVTRAFLAEARSTGRRSGFFATEHRLQRHVPEHLRSMQIGEQPVWNPADWPGILASHRSLREQLRRGRAKGVVVRRITASELALGATRDAIDRATRTWLAARRLAPMTFLVRIEPFDFAEQRDCFVAERGGRIVGFAGVVPVPARGGWFLEDLVRAPDAPNGTTELLVDAAMQRAMQLGSQWMTLGLAPLAGDVAAPLRLARRGTRPLYDFEGLRRFKAKFRPAQWMPIYFAFPPQQSAVLSFADCLSAFTPNGLLDFGLRSLRQVIA